MSGPPTASSTSLSNDQVRAIGWKDLEQEHIDMYISSGIGKVLIQLEQRIPVFRSRSSAVAEPRSS